MIDEDDDANVMMIFFLRGSFDKVDKVVRIVRIVRMGKVLVGRMGGGGGKKWEWGEKGMWNWRNVEREKVTMGMMTITLVVYEPRGASQSL